MKYLIQLSCILAYMACAQAAASPEPAPPQTPPAQTGVSQPSAPEVPVALSLNAAGLEKIEKRGVVVSLVGTGPQARLRVQSGHDVPWPGLTIAAPGGRWDWSKYEYLAFDVKNTGANTVQVSGRIDNEGGDGAQNSNTGRLSLPPGGSGTLQVLFNRAPAGAVGTGVRLFGMRGYPPGTMGAGSGEGAEGTIDPRQVTQIIIFVPRPTEDHQFEISNLRTGGSYSPPVEQAIQNFFPFIDTFGQYRHRDWPGKVHSLAELRARVAEEDRELRAHPGPESWNEYGGWKDGPALEATGFFRVAKHEDKWWLVDPAGKLFFSNGVTGVRWGTSTPIDDRATWFEDFPGDRPEFKEFWETGTHVVRGYYKGKTPVRAFNFASANLKRKYGDNWKQQAAEIAHRRLRSWGLNTVSNWSDPAVYSLRRTPYVVAISANSKPLQGSEGYWGQFRDVFDPDFREKLQTRFRQEEGKSAGDRWCIGYFVDNELSWGDEVSLAVATLRSPRDQVAKGVFLNDLKAKYPTIEALNQAWNTSHASWDALLDARTPPDAKDAEARTDLLAFNRKFAETYFRTVRDVVREVAPHQLYLGARFAWVNPLVAEAATKFCDIVSYNLYRPNVDDFKAPADVPLVIGEFHFGALDRGMFHTGLQKARNQNDRAAKYKAYVQSVLRHPNFVGCHWFTYRDEPATGRVLDEENYQIGFVDNADTPYIETVAAAREIGSTMYRLRRDAK